MSGIKVKADEEGVSILKGTADLVEEGADRIIERTERLLDEIDQYSALGPHKKSIENIVTVIQENTKGASAPARVVAEKLREKAKDYQDWIDDDIFGGGGN
jgi:hypothetical protein